MRAIAAALLLSLAACEQEQPVVIDGSSQQAFEATTAAARRQLPDADRLIFDRALRTVGGRRHSVRDTEALARVTFDGMTAEEVVADEQVREKGTDMQRMMMLLAATALAACQNQPADNVSNAVEPASGGPELSLTRLDCGHADFKDMNGFFSDRRGVYPPGPGKATDSCYLIRHGDQQMIWDTGFPAETKGKPIEDGGMTAGIDSTLAEQLQRLGLKPEDIDVVGISHMHGDHVGQAHEFTNARLVIGKRDFEQTAGEGDPFGPWRGEGKPVELLSGDKDIFGDGSVVALHLPGHTPDHLALLIKLKSGAALLSGDLYHSTISREKRSMPGFNTSREQTLASMDKFEALAKKLGAKVIIQHEPADIAKLPTFPAAAE